MNMIVADKALIGKVVNTTVVSLDDAPQGYEDFDQGAAMKFVLDPTGRSPPKVGGCVDHRVRAFARTR